jgi:hypothetical protein
MVNAAGTVLTNVPGTQKLFPDSHETATGHRQAVLGVAGVPHVLVVLLVAPFATPLRNRH